jgi:hypothetical protein
MKRVLAIGLAVATSVALVPSVSGAKAKPLKATANGWYVFDGVGPVTKTPKGGTYSRCTNNPDTPPVTQLGARYSILNKSAPKGRKYILNGPNAIHFSSTASTSVPPGNYFHRFRAVDIGQSSLPPGKYTFKLKVGKKTLTSESITLVDDTTC